MSQLEQKALPVLAALIGDGGRTAAAQPMEIAPSVAEAIAAWSAAATVIRGEIVSDVRSVDRATIAALSGPGLAAAIAQIWMVHMEVSLVSFETESPASSYWTSEHLDVQGCVALYFLRSLCLVVAFGDFVPQVEASVRLLGGAAMKIWPPQESFSWPPPRSVERIVLLRALGRADNAPRELFDRRSIRES